MLQSVDPKRRERILQCFFIVSKNALTHNVMLTPSPLIKASVKDLGLNGGGEGGRGIWEIVRISGKILATP